VEVNSENQHYSLRLTGAIVLVAAILLSVAQLLQQPGGALDVGEQEGDGPGRERCGPGGRFGPGRLGRRLPSSAERQAEPEQHRDNAEYGNDAPEDAGGRGQRLA
jgi:hypothetical protein